MKKITIMKFKVILKSVQGLTLSQKIVSPEQLQKLLSRFNRPSLVSKQLSAVCAGRPIGVYNKKGQYYSITRN